MRNESQTYLAPPSHSIQSFKTLHEWHPTHRLPTLPQKNTNKRTTFLPQQSSPEICSPLPSHPYHTLTTQVIIKSALPYIEEVVAPAASSVANPLSWT